MVFCDMSCGFFLLLKFNICKNKLKFKGIGSVNDINCFLNLSNNDNLKGVRIFLLIVENY